uniref:Uncharacterized protein n=1 Tax=Panagrolaimus superbus TaxID=310955 RepID=A0A914YB44_9BILA
MKVLITEVRQSFNQTQPHGRVGMSIKNNKFYEIMAEVAVGLEDLGQDLPNKPGADRMDYELRKKFSVKFPFIVMSLTHDGMSKFISKLPHLNTDRSKVIGDADLVFFSLNGIMVHRENVKDDAHFFVDGYFNLGDAFSGGANSVASELISSISNSSPVPPVITIQLDNSLLQEFQKQKGVRQASHLLNIYDFTSLLSPYLNVFKKLDGNHMFRIFIGNDNKPKVQIAHYIRSRHWLKCVPEGHQWELDIFKETVPSDLMPQVLEPKKDNFQKLITVANKAKNLMEEKDMRNCFAIVNELNNYHPVPFTQILEAINLNAIEIPVDAASDALPDPENEKLYQFMNQNGERVQKLWNQVQHDLANEMDATSENQDSTEVEREDQQRTNEGVSEAISTVVNPETTEEDASPPPAKNHEKT